MTMAHFNTRPGTKSAVHRLKKPVPDIAAFDAVARALVRENPLGCTAYQTVRRHRPPLEKVREMHTAKFVYLDTTGKKIGTGQDTYSTVEGYEYGVAAVLSNMANVAAHKGMVRHVPGLDLFSVIFRCHDPNGENYFLSLARDRVTVASYEDDAILRRVRHWTASMPQLA